MAESKYGAGEADELAAEALRKADDGDVVGAISLMRTHLGASSRDVRAREVMSQLLERRGDLHGAAAELGRALETQPDDVSLLCRRAAILINSQRYEQAEVDLRRAVRLDDANTDVQLNLGILNCKRARWREAIAPLERAVELDPSHPQGHYYLAEAYNQTDRLPDALLEYEAVVHLEPDNWRALKGVGIVLDKMGRPAEATLAYQRAREAQRR